MEIRRLSAALGAEVRGLDLSELSQEDFDRVRQAFYEHIVLVFPAQELSPCDQVAFTARFGPVEPHPLRSRAGVEGHPEVLVLRNEKGRPSARNDWWHSDISFAEKPPAASVLHCLQTTAGYGDTLFCNMYAAFDELSEPMKRFLSSLSALHDSGKLAVRNNAPGSDAQPIPEIPPPVEHPVVRRHAGSGRLALYVNPYFTSGFAGIAAGESRPILEYLYERATRHENVHRHRWSAGDLVMWDNRAAMHYAVYDYGEEQPRLMHRTTAGGERPSA